MIWTTDLTVSQRIKELVGEQKSIWYHVLTDIGHWELVLDSMGYHVMGNYIRVPNYGEPLDYGYRSIEDKCNAFLLSELPEVLKKVGEKLHYGSEACFEILWDGGDANLHSWAGYHYLKVCELVATNGDANAYLLELIK